MLSKQEAAALVGALVLHGAAALWLGRDRAHPEASAPADVAALEVEVEAPPVEMAPPPEPHAEPEEAAGAVALAPAHESARVPHPSNEAAPSVEGPPAPAASSSTDFTFSPTAPSLSNEALGLAGRNRFIGNLPPGSIAPDHGAAPAGPPENVAPGVDQSMADALDAHDHDIGLDAAGPLVSIAEELTRPSDAPLNGRAVFEMVIDANGDISAIRVVDAGNATASWEKVAAQMTATVRARRIAWRHKGHALAVRLEVNSQWVLPSGQAAPITPYASGAGGGVDLAAGVHFDLSDIGQHAARSVHARILGEKRL